MQIVITEGLTCPTCKSPELKDKNTLNIRAHKVFHSGTWWSHCLVCAAGDSKKGWFAS